MGKAAKLNFMLEVKLRASPFWAILAAVILAGSPSAVYAACPTGTRAQSFASPAALSELTDQALTAFRENSDDGLACFQEKMAAAEAMVTALQDPPTPATLADFYLGEGILHYVRLPPKKKADVAALRAEVLPWFRAARSVAPTHPFSVGYAPEHRMTQLWLEAGEADAAVETVEVPGWMVLLWDGTAGTTRPTDRPTLMQAQCGGGGRRTSRVARS